MQSMGKYMSFRGSLSWLLVWCLDIAPFSLPIPTQTPVNVSKQHGVDVVYVLDGSALNHVKSLVDRDLNSTYKGSVLTITTNMEWTRHLRQNRRYASHSPLLSEKGLTTSRLYQRALRELFSLSAPLQARLDAFKAQVSTSCRMT